MPGMRRACALSLALVGCGAAPAPAAPAPAPLPVVPQAMVRCGDGAAAFCDVTDAWGLHARFPLPMGDFRTLQATLAVADFDADGRADLLLTDGAEGSTTLLLNRGGRFEDASAAWGLRGEDTLLHPGARLAVAAADLDGDGHTDLLLGREIDVVDVYRNLGDRFEHVTPTPLPLDGMRQVSTLVPADLDHDGLLDVLVGTYRRPGDCMSPVGGCPGELNAFRQTAPWHFTRVPVALNAPATRRVQGIRVYDLEGDGRDEVLVSSDFGFFDGPDFLLRVDPVAGGGFSLRDDSAATGFDAAITGMGVAPLDVDGDGAPEFAVMNIGRNLLLRWDGHRFSDAAVRFRADAYGMVLPGERPMFPALDPQNPREARLAQFFAEYFDVRSAVFPTVKWAPAVADFDEDGRDDLYIPTTGDFDGFPTPWGTQNVLLRGTGGPMEDATSRYRLGLRHDTSLAVAADLDGDGDEDLALMEVANATHDGGLRVLRNDLGHGGFLTVTARGRATARDGIGAMVEVRMGARWMRRRLDGNLSLRGSGPHEAHFGLGAARSVDELRVRFPSGAVVSRQNVAAGRVTVSEAQDQ